MSEILGEIFDRLDAVQKDIRTHLLNRDKAFASYLTAGNKESKSSAYEAYCGMSVKLGEAMKTCAEVCSEFNSVNSNYTKECSAPRIPNEGSAVTAVCRIVLLPSLLPSDKPVLSIRCSARGLPRARIVSFVESVCGPLEGNYKLRSLAGVEIISDETTWISPGSYALVPETERPPLAFKFQAYPIISSGRLSTGGSQASSSSQPTGDGGVGVKRGRASLSSDAEDKNCRNSNFKHELYKRDNHCVISRDYETLQASHILADAWWGPERRQILPSEIVDIVQYLPDTIDSVQNGLLLRNDLAQAFDEGKISVQYQGNHYRVIAISPVYEEYDGRLLDENTRIRYDGTSWWQAGRPHPDLLAFHLRNSVFRHMTAAGSDDDSENGDDECLSPVCKPEDSAVDSDEMMTPKRQQTNEKDSKTNECMRLDTGHRSETEVSGIQSLFPSK